MTRMQGLLRIVSVVFILALLTAGTFWSISSQPPRIAHAENNGVAVTPFMGWSTWNFIGHNPTEANVEAQARAEATNLKAHGFTYVMLDDFYYLDPRTTVDSFGRWVVDPAKFPHGLKAVADYVHGLGLKFGSYLTPGIPVAAVNQNTPIEGTGFHAKDIANTSKLELNYNFHNVNYYIDYSKPGSQAFINSWANQLASWGVDFLKIDGVGTFDIPDIQAWSQALNNSGRPILFDLSNNLNVNSGSVWEQNANAWRTGGDVECYGGCPGHLVDWSHISSHFASSPKWAQFAGPGGWNDLDAMDVADGNLDGITNTERQTYMTMWASVAAPMYMGDDLTTMDSFGLSLLSNDEVIAVDQAGKVATPVSQASSQQVWRVKNADGSFTVALFNLGTSTATVTANWSDLGFSGSAAVHDVWSHGDLGSFTNSFSASLASHASRLLKVTAGSGGGTPTPTPNPGTTSYEAESSANTLAGGAKVATCSACSGGQKVGFVGKGGTLQFNSVSKSMAGSYTLTIYYVDGDAGRTANMSVNGGTATSITFHGTNDSNWNFVQHLTVTVNLNAGNNTILFSNPTAWAPDFDRITV
ncbi:MAG TPA: alpha-galactosidase [Ktedonosporobacter sp.]|nr:alpha-galactosidase [Ktedonosporobacter sp.]